MPPSSSPSSPSLFKPVSIGSLSLGGNVFLAPLAGFTDRAMRSVCIECGARLGFTEMLSAEGLVRGGRKTRKLLERAENETALAAQIFTADPDTAARCVEMLASFEPALIDLNCGCPVPKVVKHGAGSALLADPGSIFRIVGAMVRAAGVPVTVKIRSGWDAASINYLETGLAAQEAGAAAVCLHARTRSQGYSGRADYSHIRELKRRLSIPVFGSGDLHSPEDALRMLEQTGCDGLMIARGAIGNPFIFGQIEGFLRGAGYAIPPAHERLEMALRQLGLCARDKGEPAACREMRKHFCAYSKGLPGGAELRRKLVGADSLEDYARIVRDYLAAVDALDG